MQVEKIACCLQIIIRFVTSMFFLFPPQLRSLNPNFTIKTGRTVQWLHASWYKHRNGRLDINVLKKTD